MSLAALWPAPVQLGPTDSRHQSHALVAHEGKMVVDAKLRSFAYLAT
jgi:hypothetical protein